MRASRRALLGGTVAWLSVRCLAATPTETAAPSRPLATATATEPVVTATVPPATPSPTPTPFVNPYGVVDASTLDRKMLFGYQGWFSAAGDGSRFGNEWHHWTKDAQRPSPANVQVDNWPDLSEFGSDELFPTDLVYPDGRQVFVYSGYSEKTVLRHFRWMGEHGLDGVTVQRFLQTPWDPRAFDFRNRVLSLARGGAERYGRVFAVEIDITSMTKDVAESIRTDWAYIVDELRVTESARYLRHRGRPVLGVWGLGFNGNPLGAAEAGQLVAWLQRDAPERYRATILGGVPWFWRTQSGEKSDPAWAAVRSLDVISPWHVGAILPAEGAVEEWRARIVGPDVAEAKAAGRDYMPVVFPGFSWSNLMRGTPVQPQKLNAYPRRGGAFWWRQLYNDLAAGSRMIKAAMFDELDEGTAMYKLASTAAGAPSQPGYVTLDADGLSLPSDWYLRLGGAGTKMVRGEIPLTATIPIAP